MQPSVGEVPRDALPDAFQVSGHLRLIDNKELAFELLANKLAQLLLLLRSEEELCGVEGRSLKGQAARLGFDKRTGEKEQNTANKGAHLFNPGKLGREGSTLEHHLQ